MEVFQYGNKSTHELKTTKFASNAFVDAFTDLLFDINVCPSGTPITVEWNPNLPRYDSTCDTQVFKAFTDLPKDLPFVYGSLTVSHTSFRPCLGPKNLDAFHVPGMEFFATTGEYKNETEWRNPAARWLRQIIPKGDQLPKFLDEYEKIYIKDLPGHTYNFVDDAFDGRITVSHKGVHFAETQYGYSEGHGFWEDEFVTDLTQDIQSTEVLHILIPCNSVTHKVITVGESGECAGQMDSECNSNISSAMTGSAAGQDANIVVCAEEPGYCDLLNAKAQAPDIQVANGEEKATCFQWATDSKESLNESASAAESSTWRPASLPFTFCETHYQFTDRWFRQITPLGISNARSLGTNAIPKAPRLEHAFGALGPMPQAPPIPSVLRHTASLQDQSKAPDILSLRAITEAFLASLNAQAQAPDDPSPTFPSDCHLLSLRAFMQELSASFNAQDKAPDDLHSQDRQCAPCIFVDYSHHDRPELVRFTTKQNVSHPSLQLLSQDSVRELFNRLMTLTYQGVSRIEFHVCYLWIPVVRQGVDCFYSVGLGCSWTFTVIIFNDQCGSTLFALLTPSLVFIPRHKRYMWGVFPIRFIGFSKLNFIMNE